ncbi:MAG: hypothetical protein ACFFD1_11675 [Candidatus Thorarchaeota archaeon]
MDRAKSSNFSNFPDFSIADLNPTERLIIKFVSRWKRSILPNTRDIATELNLPQSTVSSSLKRMKETKANDKLTKKSSTKKKNSDMSKLFEWEPHHGVALTAFGKKIAEHIEHHHHVMEIYLHKSLGLEKVQAHHESELLSLSLSCNLSNIIAEKFNLDIDSLSKLCICPEDHEKGCILGQ